MLVCGSDGMYPKEAGRQPGLTQANLLSSVLEVRKEELAKNSENISRKDVYTAHVYTASV